MNYSGRNLFLIPFAAATGYIAWHYYMPLCILIPFLWTRAATHKTAWLIGLAYHLAASTGIISGASVFFDSESIHLGLGIWMSAGLIQSFPYFICSLFPSCSISIVFLLITLIFPPVGIVGWANPLTPCGFIFPGTGLWGLTILVLVMAIMPFSYQKNKFIFLAVTLILLILPLIHKDIKNAPNNIVGVTTEFTGHPSSALDRFQKDFQKFITIRSKFSGSEFKTLVLPEASAGIWFDTTQHLWSRWQISLKPGQAVLLNGLVPEEGTRQTKNAIILMTREEFKIIYQTRQPVPIGMWKPWDPENVKTNWLKNPIFKVSGKKATALVCYEAYLVWPVLHSFLSGKPEYLIVPANHWWSKGTSLISIQKNCVSAWAKLFGVKPIIAINS